MSSYFFSFEMCLWESCIDSDLLTCVLLDLRDEENQ